MDPVDVDGQSKRGWSWRRPRALALDFDGTLTEDGRPAEITLDGLNRLRRTGISVILVTGRILAELEGVFEDVADYFDAIVAENGAVVAVGDHVAPVTPPVDRALLAALDDVGVGAQQGMVIVATSGSAEHEVLDAVGRLGLECQLIHNRTELMVLPSGVNKGSGLAAALIELGLSPHDCIAVGDAENDHSLLAGSEFGVAVANAVDSLKSEADLVLASPNGAGVDELIEDILQANRFWNSRSRPTIEIGRDADQRPVSLSARPTNMIIVGGSGGGKSFLAGLIAEQLIAKEYSVLVVDPEGDHVGLGALSPAVVVGADGPPPPVDTVVALLRHSDACVIVDLSSLDESDRRSYLLDVPVEVEACRRARGRPHWVFFDEAHQSLGHHEAAIGALEPAARGYCLITWRPEDLPPTVVASTEVVLAITSPAPEDPVVDLVAAVAGRPREAVAALLSQSTQRVVVARRNSMSDPEVAQFGSRITPHQRHEHKYVSHGTDPERSFWFRNDRDQPMGVVARNLRELERELTQCPRSVLRHHAPSGDFSRWIEDVFRDASLASAVASIESRVQPTSPGAVVDAARLDMITALRNRRST